MPVRPGASRHCSSTTSPLHRRSAGRYHERVLIPIGTDRPLSRLPLMVPVLIGINAVIFGIGMAMDRGGENPEALNSFQERFSLHPEHIHWWALFSYAFLHAGFMHLAGNMVFLWVLGPNVEDRFGRIGFLLFYLAGGAAAGGLHCLFSVHPVLGASGSIAAVTGAYLVLFPRTEVKVFLLLIVIGIYRIPAVWFILAQIAFDFWSTGMGSGNVATVAHLGGYGFGVALSMFLLATGILKREMYDLFSLSRHAARRKQFQAAGREQARIAAQRATRAAQPGPSDELAKARAEVTVPLLEGDLPAAAAAYRRLMDAHGATVSAALLSRKSQYDLANSLFAAGDHQTAATAYRLFMEGYPKDSELSVVRLMLGLINARYLNDPIKAKQEISEAMGGLPDGDHKQLARELLAELG